MFRVQLQDDRPTFYTPKSPKTVQAAGLVLFLGLKGLFIGFGARGFGVWRFIDS